MASHEMTDYVERGFCGRGSFFNGLGQARDMVQGHLLQVFGADCVGPVHGNERR